MGRSSSSSLRSRALCAVAATALLVATQACSSGSSGSAGPTGPGRDQGSIPATASPQAQSSESLKPTPQPKPTEMAGPTTGQALPGKDMPACPAELSGVLTHPLMDPKYIAALTPLGNLNPPGHTSPVDHIYFATKYTGRIPLYAPADAQITTVTQDLVKYGSGGYKPNGYVVTYTLCRGVQIILAGYADVSPGLKAELATQSASCSYWAPKPGHDDSGEGQCMYNKLSYAVKSGDELGWTQATQTQWGLELAFEIWAVDYNHVARSDVTWDYFGGYDAYYPYAFCLFDMYSGSLKDSFYSKFGLWDTKSKPARFTPRTVAPKCGQTTQDIFDTIQGMWFGGPPDPKHNYEFEGKGLAIVHNNIDPTKAELSIGGFVTKNAGVSIFTPKHSGLIDREPSEVKADGMVYCYNLAGAAYLDGKLLIALLDGRHLKVEHQAGKCTGHEALKNPAAYQR